MEHLPVDATWPTPEGPYSGNADFPIAVQPKLEQAWEYPITSKHNDGKRVGGRGKVVVPIRGRDLVCLSLDTGKPLWEARKARLDEEELYLGGPFVWARSGGDYLSGFEGTALDLGTGKAQKVRASLLPQGVVQLPRGSVLLLRTGSVSLESMEVTQGTEMFTGRVYQNLLYATQSKADPQGQIVEMGVGCYDPVSASNRWLVAPEAQIERILAVAEDVLVSFSHTKEIRVRARTSGSLLWRTATEHVLDTISPCVVSEGLVFRWEGRTLLALDIRTGTPAWEYHASDRRSNLLGTKGFLWLGAEDASGKFHLLALEKKSGKPAADILMKGQVAGYALSLVDTSLICTVGRKLVCYRLSS